MELSNMHEHTYGIHTNTHTHTKKKIRKSRKGKKVEIV